MCGIAGVVTFDGSDVTTMHLKIMTDCMVQRGPDDDGFVSSSSVGLGMRRLSVIDVAGGHQPIANESGEIQLVLNGEIYNHVELRRALTARGHMFRTASDAEVVLHLYEEKGVEALAELNGMFAFALYDTRSGTLWIARDRLGIKPLFFAQTSTRLVFASDITALRANFPTELDPQQVVKFFALSYVPGDETVWRGVRKLPPAHYLIVTGQNVEIRRYWGLDSIAPFAGTLESAAEALDELLVDAVRMQLRSDVPLGIFLSGGLDSSAIVALASREVPEPLRTFTVAFEGKQSDDARLSRVVADSFGTEHVEISMAPEDAHDALNEIIPKLDEPLSDSALIPAYAVSKAARERGVKVLLNGAGGDEIFGGYARHSAPRVGSPRWAAERIPSPARGVVAAAWGMMQPDRGTRAGDARLAWASNVSGINFHSAKLMLRSGHDYLGMLNAIRKEHGAMLGSPGEPYAYSRMKLDLQTYLPQDILAVTDRATMAASVEGRVPLLDHRLVEFGLSLPPEYNLLGGQPKGLFREVMRKRLPAEVLSRPKAGFNAPDDIWLQDGSALDLSAELLGAPTPVLNELIDSVALEKILRNKQLRAASASMLFALYLFNRWARVHLSQQSAA